ncbi:MAG: hypothetical protein AAGK67_18120 [Pseudomonadota bacterium]
MAKKKLPDHFLKDMQALAKELEAESERGTVILSASMLEEALGLILRTAIHADVDDKIQRELFLGQGAMASFSARSKLCYVFGYISSDEFKAIDTIREIRNQFAHFSAPTPQLSEQRFTDKMANVRGLFPVEYDACLE